MAYRKGGLTGEAGDGELICMIGYPFFLFLLLYLRRTYTQHLRRYRAASSFRTEARDFDRFNLNHLYIYPRQVPTSPQTRLWLLQ